MYYKFYTKIPLLKPFIYIISQKDIIVNRFFKNPIKNIGWTITILICIGPEKSMV